MEKSRLMELFENWVLIFKKPLLEKKLQVSFFINVLPKQITLHVILQFYKKIDFLSA